MRVHKIAAVSIATMSCFACLACSSEQLNPEATSELAQVNMAGLPDKSDPANSKVTVTSSAGSETLSAAKIGDKTFKAGLEYTFAIQLYSAKNELLAQTKENVPGCAPVKKVLVAGANDIKIVACEVASNEPLDDKSKTNIEISTIPDPNMTKENTLLIDEAGDFAGAFYTNVKASNIDAGYKVFEGKKFIQIEKTWVGYTGSSTLQFVARYDKLVIHVVCALTGQSLPQNLHTQNTVKVWGEIDDRPMHFPEYNEQMRLNLDLKNCAVEKI